MHRPVDDADDDDAVDDDDDNDDYFAVVDDDDELYEENDEEPAKHLDRHIVPTLCRKRSRIPRTKPSSFHLLKISEKL